MLTNKFFVAITVMLLIIHLMGCEESKEVTTELNFEIKIDKHEYLQLEPIRATVFLENDSETEFLIKYKATKQRAAKVIFVEVRGDGTLRDIGAAVYPPETGICGNSLRLLNRLQEKPKTWSIKENSSYIQSHWLIGNHFKGLFEPGEHTIRAIFQPLPRKYRNAKYQSNDIKIKVIEPRDHDLEAYKFMRRRKAFKIGGRGFGPGIVARALIPDYRSDRTHPILKYFLEHFGDSLYANYVQYTLATASRSVKADKMIDLINQSSKNFPLLGDAYANLLEHYREHGDVDKMEILSKTIKLDELTITNPNTSEKITALVKYVQTLKNNVNKKGVLDQTPLFKAAEDGHSGTIRFLIANGADVNAINENGKTPLHFAAKSGHKETVEMLIAAGADVNIRCKSFGRTAIFWPCHNGYKEVAEVLIANGADINVRHDSSVNPLLTAVLQNKSEIVKLLIANGADVHVRDDRGHSNGWTPLHWAVRENQKEIVKLLLEGGADVHARNRNDETSLDIAIKRGDKELIGLLSLYRPDF